ncbi:MAG TPA: hydroxyisourate hydrolase [Bacteroidota bacterium]|nr:hydroxyisourate hydrolase [Bacteroidota bacterium]
MRSPITTHVLDTSLGKPAVGVLVQLDEWSDGEWVQIGSGVTDADGRILNLLPSDRLLSNTTYRLTFFTQKYFSSRKQESIYPKVSVEFFASPGQHYHIPLLISPYGYTTYRGS